MRLGILADTHDALARTRTAVALLRDAGAEALVHCGDITGPEVVSACRVLPCHFAFGNHDCDNIPLLESAIADSTAACLGWGGVVELAGQVIAITHGHLHLRELLKQSPDYLLFGHTHVAEDRQRGGTRLINSGALFDADQYSVALLDLASGSVQFFSVQ